MLSHSINPILIKFSFIQITYYSLVYILGFLTILYILLKASKTNEINIKESQVYDLLIFLILGLLIGARLFHIIFWNFQYYLNDPIKIFFIWQGGFAFHGGLMGAFLALFLYSKKHNLNFPRLLDLLVLPGIFFLALGRIANFINQEIVGTITSLPWCFNFKYNEGCRHPIQLYAALGRFSLFTFLLYIKNTLSDFRPGFLFWTFLTLISTGRFLLDFLRLDTRYLELTAGQWLSIPFIIFGIYILNKYYRKDLRALNL
jgi:phosphatidylglycerol---prolipoprotein diacylglyceryl transferase